MRLISLAMQFQMGLLKQFRMIMKMKMSMNINIMTTGKVHARSGVREVCASATLSITYPHILHGLPGIKPGASD
jgi:hypothetical protein